MIKINFGQIDRIARKIWVGYPGAVATVAVASFGVALVKSHLDVPNVSMLYLIAVIISAVAFGSGPAILASLLSLFTFNWFLSDEPNLVNAIRSDDWTALTIFLITALVTGQLAAQQRKKAQEAREREREASFLYDLTRLMSEQELQLTLDIITSRLLQELPLSAIIAEVSESEGQDVVKAEAGNVKDLGLARSADRTPAVVLQEGQSATREQHAKPGAWIPVVLQPAQVLSRKLIHDWIPSVPIPTPGLKRLVIARVTLPIPIPRAVFLGRKHPDRLSIVPVTVQKRPAGVLVLMIQEDCPGLTEADARLLSAVARQLGLGIERLQLQNEVTEVEILRRADELKTALINAVSHDLRTPLASITTAAGSLRRRDVKWSDEDRAEFAQAIEEEAQRLNRIVENLLDLSRMEAGILKPEKTPYSIRKVSADLVARLYIAAAQHHLIIDIPNDLPLVPMDPVQIDQVMSNLVENALKYTPRGTEIRITAYVKDDRLYVEVADRGPGIPSASLPHIFKAFYRDPEQKKGKMGSGLGLAVVQGLLEAHGGKIWAQNREGGGASFLFILPLSNDNQRAPAQEARSASPAAPI